MKGDDFKVVLRRWFKNAPQETKKHLSPIPPPTIFTQTHFKRVVQQHSDDH